MLLKIAVEWLDFTLNQNKPTCKMFPNNNHEICKVGNVPYPSSTWNIIVAQVLKRGGLETRRRRPHPLSNVPRVLGGYGTKENYSKHHPSFREGLQPRTRNKVHPPICTLQCTYIYIYTDTCLDMYLCTACFAWFSQSSIYCG